MRSITVAEWHESATDRELMHVYFNSNVGFADESIHLARRELTRRGYKFGTLGNIVGWRGFV